MFDFLFLVMYNDKQGENMLDQKRLEILSESAKYDVSCSSSGSRRQNTKNGIGNACFGGICHSFTADGRCISLLKILFTNECIYDCKYCVNRASNDVVRASFTPEEVAELTMEFYRRNYIEGLFLSSGILVSPNYTMELIYQALRLLRVEYHFNGYIHCKAIPGAAPELVERVGFLADRMSVNLELPTADGLKNLAPHKHRKNILKPMRQIQLSKDVYNKRKLTTKSSTSKQILLADDLYGQDAGQIQLNDRKESILETREILGVSKNPSTILTSQDLIREGEVESLESEVTSKIVLPRHREKVRKFVPAGQSTQMIIGATNESDYQIMSVSESLYRKFELKRVFYSAFIRVNEDKKLPVLPGGPPLLREHRLYQADWLLRFYGFQTNELLSEKRPNFNVLLDPKCDWAVSHLEHFPIEIQKANYYTLLRVPGIGVKSANRIIQARKHAKLDFNDLKKLGVVLKRAAYFITCNGKMMLPTKIEEDYITRNLVSNKEKLPFDRDGMTYRQLSLFDDNMESEWQLAVGG